MLKDLETTINNSGQLALARAIELIQTISVPPWIRRLSLIVLCHLAAAELTGSASPSAILSEVLKAMP